MPCLCLGLSHDGGDYGPNVQEAVSELLSNRSSFHVRLSTNHPRKINVIAKLIIVLQTETFFTSIFNHSC